MSIITKTGLHYGSAELLFSDGTDWHAFYSVRERRLLFGFIPFKKQVATARFSFPQHSASPHRDGFREAAREARWDYFGAVAFL